MANLIFLLLTVVCVLGCSRQQAPYASSSASGDLGAFVLHCVTNRGGHLLTNSVAAVEAKWTLPVHPSFDVIKVPGDRFTEIVEFLRQALGELNPQQSSR